MKKKELSVDEVSIELDIPFVISEEKIKLILQWFPKLTLIGLFLRDVKEEQEEVKRILLLLASRQIKAIVYSLDHIAELQSEIVSFN